MSYRESIEEAAAAVADATLPAEFRADAFRIVLESILGKGIAVAPTLAAPPRSPMVLASGDELTRVGAALKLSRDDAGAIFEVVDGAPEMNVHSSRVPGTRVQAVRDFAVLVTSAREAVGLETTDKEVRGALNRYGKYDATNFTKQLAGVDPSHISYSKTTKKITLRNPGREHAQALAAKYASGAE